MKLLLLLSLSSFLGFGFSSSSVQVNNLAHKSLKQEQDDLVRVKEQVPDLEQLKLAFQQTYSELLFHTFQSFPESLFDEPEIEVTVNTKRTFEQESTADDKRKRTASTEWNSLLNLSPRSEELLTNPDYLRIIRSRLAEEGPESVAALMRTHPRFLERQDFLPMLREVLHDNIVDIAQIYASDLNTTRPILYMIDEQLGSTEYYIQFLFELLKSENGIKVTRQFVESLLDNRSFLEEFDFSELHGSILTSLAHLSVRLDFIALVDKIAAVSKKHLEQRVVIDGNSINVYTHVRSVPMLKKLFELRILVPSLVEFSNRQVPFVYHFMRMPDPAFKDCIRKSRIIPRMKIMESIAYCRQIENDELVSELADLLGLARIKKD